MLYYILESLGIKEIMDMKHEYSRQSGDSILGETLVP